MRVVFAVLCLIALVGCQHQPPAYEPRYSTPPPEPTRAVVAPPHRAPFDPASINRALEAAQPYTISVVGDSTSNYVDEWVHILSRRIAESYGRTVAVRDWDVERNSYPTEQEHLYGTSGAPVTVWNASSPGKSAEYSLHNYHKMMPEQTDLTIISHGHSSPESAVRGVVQLTDVAYRNTSPGGGVLVVLQNPRTDSFAAPRAKVVDQLRQLYSDPSTGAVLLDINSAFKAAPDLSSLLRPDGVHPNPAGSQLWADAVVARLGLR